MVWPSPETATVTVTAGASTIALPVRAPRPEDDRLASFARAEASALSPRATLVPGSHASRVERDVATGTVTVVTENDLGVVRHDPHGLIYGIVTRAQQSIRVVVTDSANVSIVKTVTGDMTVNAGQGTSFQLKVVNDGPSDAAEMDTWLEGVGGGH